MRTWENVAADAIESIRAGRFDAKKWDSLDINKLLGILVAEIEQLKKFLAEQTRRAEAAEDEAATLAGTVERFVDWLPKTADGIVLLPDMAVYCLSSWGEISKVVINNWNAIAWMSFSSGLWYSTYEAAEKARKEKL